MNATNKYILTLLLALSSHSVFAGPWEDFESSFSSFMIRLGVIGNEAEREYVLGQLTQLHRDLYLIEKDKQYLIFMMERPGMVDGNISYVLKDVTDRTKDAQEKLRNIGDRVARISTEASKLEDQLNESLNSRKYWLSRVNANNIQNSNLRNLLIEGRIAVKAVHDSRRELEQFLGSR